MPKYEIKYNDKGKRVFKHDVRELPYIDWRVLDVRQRLSMYEVSCILQKKGRFIVPTTLKYLKNAEEELKINILFKENKRWYTTIERLSQAFPDQFESVVIDENQSVLFNIKALQDTLRSYVKKTKTLESKVKELMDFMIRMEPPTNVEKDEKLSPAELTRRKYMQLRKLKEESQTKQ